ncbi:ABC transporter substrate-binding protein [Erythrobacter sp. NE805]|uniref:ABC transporter substrate-binding protein n=1 Tax=Erythrobacter sp. NE805 TaxID=3389875 RepID=UPI00396AF687
MAPRGFLALLIAALIAFLPGAAAADTLKVGLSTRAGPFDFAIAPAADQTLAVRAAYETLVRSTPGGGYRGGVAAGWSTSRDGLVWTFRLQPGRRFASGRPVDAAAVVFTLARLKAIGRGNASLLGDLVASAEPAGPNAVRLRLIHPSPALLALLSDRMTSIIDPSIANRIRGDRWGSQWLATRTAGSGRFQLQPGSQRGIHILTVQPHWRPLPGDPQAPAQGFDRLVYREIVDPTVRRLALEKGEIDIAFLLPSQEQKRLARTHRAVLHRAPILAFNNLAFNLRSTAVADVRLRRAIGHAIDVAGIIRYIRGGTALPFAGPVPPSMLGHGASRRFTHNPALALRLAAQARTPARPLRFIYPGVSPETDTIAQYIQAALKPLGLDVRIERLSVPAYLDRMARGSYDMVLQGAVIDFNDPSAIMNAWFEPSRAGISNPARYGNPRVTALIRQSEREMDPARRRQQIEQAARLTHADVPYIYLSQTVMTIAARKDIRGITIDPFDALNLPVNTMRRGS